MIQKNKINKVVLAYSGGLDTSVIVPWLIENYGCEVICYAADVGQAEELDGLEERALQGGASKLIVDDLREELTRDYIFPMLRSGAIYDRKYLLGTSIARPLIAKRQVEIAEQEGAQAVAHGCTGKGNDQVRFEMAFTALNPKLHVIAPWREWDINSREDALDYLKAHNIDFPENDNPSLYSRDRNMWHISHEGGPLEDIANAPLDDLFVLSTTPENAPDQAEEISIRFEKGDPVAINDEVLSPVEIIEYLNKIGGKHGIGQVDLVENRLVGMKSRGVYETPGGTILYLAHSELETITLDKDTMHYKDTLAMRYSELLYNGKWFSPLREALDAFFKETQKPVSGVIRLKLYKGNVIILSRQSSNSLYREEFASFKQSPIYDQSDAAGFIRLFGLPSKVQAMLEMGVDDIPEMSPDEIQRD